MIDPAIKNRIELLSPAYQEFVKSDFARELARSLGEVDKFDEDRIAILSNGIMLYLLLFLDFTELIKFISSDCTVTTDHATRLAGAVVASLPDDFHKMHQEAYGAFSVDNETKEMIEEIELNSDIAETEATLKAIPPFRTMGNDMAQAQAKEEKTYSSTQDTILKRDNVTPKENFLNGEINK
jgi:hypothetical protein